MSTIIETHGLMQATAYGSFTNPDPINTADYTPNGGGAGSAEALLWFVPSSPCKGVLTISVTSTAGTAEHNFVLNGVSSPKALVKIKVDDPLVESTAYDSGSDSILVQGEATINLITFDAKASGKMDGRLSFSTTLNQPSSSNYVSMSGSGQAQVAFQADAE